MSMILACAFPISVAVALLRLLPVQVPERSFVIGDRGGGVGPETAPLPYRQHLAYALPYLLGSFALAYPLGVMQRALFQNAGRGTAVFSHRVTDLPVYPFLPALFLGMVVSFPILFRALKWYLGDTLFDIIDRPDRSSVPMSLRQTIGLFPTMTWAIAILATLLNVAAFDTFLQITDREFSYSTFSSPRTHRHALDEVQELTIYSRRVAPNGNILIKTWLKIRLNSGETLDTFYLVEPDQVAEVVRLIEGNPAFSGRVARLDGPKS